MVNLVMVGTPRVFGDFGFIMDHKCHFHRIPDWNTWSFFKISLNLRWPLLTLKIIFIGSYLPIHRFFPFLYDEIEVTELKKQLYIKVKVISNANTMYYFVIRVCVRWSQGVISGMENRNSQDTFNQCWLNTGPASHTLTFIAPVSTLNVRIWRL